MTRSTQGRGGSTKKRTTARATPVAKAPAVDRDTRSEIWGIILAAVALALGIAVVSEGTGLLTDVLVTALKALFGIGAYVLPVLLLLWAATFFISGLAISERRVGGGLGLCLLAVISAVAVSSPAEERFELAVLQDHGGYLGGAVSWALTTLVGETITYVLLAATLLCGLVITGLSISALIDRARSRLVPEDDSTRPARPARSRAERTLPIDDHDIEPALPGSTDASARRTATRKQPSPTATPTVPIVKGAAPRAMEGFELPARSLLTMSPESSAGYRAGSKELKARARLIEETLATFDIPARVHDWIAGPTVTLFEIELSRGVKVNRVTSLADDLALALAAPTVRILAPIPGKSLVGVEVPNERRSTVTLGDVLAAEARPDGTPLLLGIGKDVSGESVLADLATMPHLLIAGSTGTGKSVCINALLTCVLMRATPSEVRLILIDPKRIELSLYNGVPHLYVPVVTEPKEAASALAWAVGEMETRLRRLQAAGARNIGSYNAMVHEGKAPEGAEEMPYLVIVIDELADLMMVAAKEVEDSICRLAQLARAAGIHLIVATQRPSTDIITGLIKTNITHRIAFAVSSGIDSRVILDQPGADKLVGLGDMLFSTPALSKPKRVQGAFVSEDEISAVVSHLKAQAEPEYHEEILHLKVTPGGSISAEEEDDPLIWEAADIVVTSGIGSTSLLQRRLKVGYARAGRIMDMLEAKGVVGPPDGSKPRSVLVDIEDLESIRAFERRDQAGEVDPHG